MTHEPRTDPPSRAHLTKMMALDKMINREALDTALSMTGAIYWATDNAAHVDRLQNGSLFFVDAGLGVFGVTAAHVVESCLEDESSAGFRSCMIARNGTPYPINLSERIICRHKEMDLATLRFSEAEVREIGRTVVRGHRDNWPPPLPREHTAITYCGFPGVGRTVLEQTNLTFKAVVMQGPRASAHETCISIQIAREQLEQHHGNTAMPLNFNFSGMSGGPALSYARDFPDMTLQGVIFRGPNPSTDPAQAIEGFELISIRPAHFINADGTLDVQRWESNQAW